MSPGPFAEFADFLKDTTPSQAFICRLSLLACLPENAGQ
jgi:hypothetical protein